MRWLLPILTIVCLQVGYAQEHTVDSSFVHPDTLSVYVDNYGHMFMYHTSDVPVDVFQLARYYGVSTREVMDAGKLVKPRKGEEALKAYLIPIGSGKMLDKEDCFSEDCIPVVYTVRPQETVFRISKRYFNIKPNRLKEINGLESNDIGIGQRLVVGWFSPQMSEEKYPEYAALDTTRIEDPFFGATPQKAAGLAYWNKAQTDYSNMFAMHNEAAINTFIEISNPMFGTSVLVKVIGKIPPSFTNDIMLVVSPAVARELKVLDARFRAEIKYVAKGSD